MDLDYLQWCLKEKKLSDQEFALYSILKAIGSCEITKGYIANIWDKGREPVRIHIKALEKKGFVLYDNTNSEGLSIFWVRQNSQEIQPEKKMFMIKAVKYKVVSPEGKISYLKRGNIAQFCRQNSLSRNNFQKVLSGQAKSHKGWRLA